ncbi:dihydrofolate reductase family protein [Propionibacteriaceae bacterium G1746]|uniref:dihydrofolate reductase family protein n=1 Tax=Aestuariimicrobium sp. G57 TaxID=3418485 RepID=UPI003C2A350A
MSRKLIAGLFYSVDGVASDPNTFQYDSFDADLGALMTTTIAPVDEIILGRVTYQEWAGYWPNVTEGDDSGFADFINTTPKHVASSTLTPVDLTWNNSSLVTSDLLAFIRQLKQRPGGDIAVQGSLSVVRQCVDAGLMDELSLIVHPALAGGGRRLFEGANHQRLTLLRSQQTEKGNIVATYGPFAG